MDSEIRHPGSWLTPFDAVDVSQVVADTFSIIGSCMSDENMIT